MFKNLNKEADRTDLLARLENLRANSTGQWGKMTANQMLCHLADTVRVCLHEKEAPFMGKWYDPLLTKWFALSPVPWPKGKIKAPPMLDPTVGGAQPVEFEQDKQAFIRLIVQYGQTQSDYPWPKHPILGVLTYAQWGRFHYVHFDHHFRQFGI